jgi:hypothetical protein
MRPHQTLVPREWILRNPQGQELFLRLLPGQTVTVGRDLASDLPVLDAGISRHHASFSLDGEELWLEDLHSQNGTFVNTERVRRARVLPGDIITFGRVPLMISVRTAAAAEVDPVRRLPRESLAQLVHLLRELGAEQSRAMLYQKLLELAMRAVKADRGLVLLWEERRDHFHTVAASPQGLFQNALGLVSHALALSTVRTGKARILGEPLAPGTDSVIVTPVKSESGAVGVLYLDRVSTRPAFGAAELELITALTWASAATLQGARDAQPAPEQESGLEQRLLARSSPFAPSRRGPAPGSGFLEAGGEALLLGLEQHVLARASGLAACQAPDDARLEEATTALHAARLGIEGVRRLLEERTGELVEISIDRLAGELAAIDRARHRYVVATGGELCALGDAQALLLVLRLCAAELDGSAPAGADGTPLRLSASPAHDEGMVVIRLEADGMPEADLPSPGDGFLLGLVGRLTQELLHGRTVHLAARRGVEVHVPQPAASWRETVLLRPAR